MIQWKEIEPDEWLAEWKGFKLVVSRLNPEIDPERWYWGLTYGKDSTLHIGDPSGEAPSLDKARESASVALMHVLDSESSL